MYQVKNDVIPVNHDSHFILEAIVDKVTIVWMAFLLSSLDIIEDQQTTPWMYASHALVLDESCQKAPNARSSKSDRHING